MAAIDSTGMKAVMFVTIVAAFGAALISASYDLSRDRIAENRRLRLESQLEAVLGGRFHDNDIAASRRSVVAPDLLGTRDPVDFYTATANGNVLAVVIATIAPNGYNGPINLLVGITSDGRVSGVRVASHRETPGLGDAIEIERSDWIEGYSRRSLADPIVADWRVTKDAGRFDTITGATVTSRAVTDAVRNALLYFRDNRESLLTLDRNGSAFREE